MTSTPPRKSNRLASESSAYLRQHQDNPVDWYPWGEEALARARTEDKPLCVSIGYSACHWCHVMEHESFEDETTAAEMNRAFINIKVDREERPDIDQIYMDTLVSLNGHGGWPLTVFCTPDGKPFYAGTYFPPERRHGSPAFREVLAAVLDAYRNQREQVETMAERILEALASRREDPHAAPPGPSEIQAAARELMSRADTQHGGFGDAPKFPTPTQLEFLLSALDFLPEDERNSTLDHCVLTCHEMSRRGLYDHLGGGFHRYCVDGSWTIPHFEKMLYDEGLLIRAYLEAWRRSGTRDPNLLWPVDETVAFLRREMSAEDGGYFASQDADSEGEEGLFYVWTPGQVAEILGDDSTGFAEAYGVTEQGNFERHTTHLVDVARRDREEFLPQRQRLFEARAGRIPPATDFKRVASWNGYTISGFARGAGLLGDASLLDDATRAADFILDRMRDSEGRLLRVYNEGRAQIGAFLDDHASLLDACLELHRAGAGDRFLGEALGFAQQIRDRFFDPDIGDLFLSPSDAETLVHRPRSDHDGATPHATGFAALGLVRVGALSGQAEFAEIADRVALAHSEFLRRQPAAFPTLLRAVALATRGLRVAVVVGEPDCPKRAALLTRARRILGPEDAVVGWSPGAPVPPGLAASWLHGRETVNGEATAYLCQGETCSLPATTPDELASRL